MQVPLTSFKVRLIGFLGLLLSTLFAAWIWQSWNEAGEYVEAEERGQVRTLVQTLAPLVDGELHERAVGEFPEADEIHAWAYGPTWLQYLRRTLVDGVRHASLESPIYTLRLRESARNTVLADRKSVHLGALEMVLTSSTTPAWRHTADYLPEMGAALFDGQVSTTGVYRNALGSWISAFAPISDGGGRVVGLLKADASVSTLPIQVRQRMSKKATFGLIVLLFALMGWALLTLSITRALTRVQLAALRLGAGDYSTQLEISNSSREIRDLADAFESARARIASYIEAQERLVSALEMTRIEAESANKAKSLFLANMSHDLRTPLNAIIGFIQILRQGDLDPEQREIVDTVQRASESLHKIVGDILDFSRITEGNLELAETRFDVRELIQETGERMSIQAQQIGLEFTWSWTPDIPDTVYGDPTRLRQILTHLIDNAIKFTEVGSIRFSCNVDHVDETGTTLRFEVVDTGSGIQPERQARLFEPFTQDEEDEGSERGTGIGLSLCRSLCRLLGGEIGAVSNPGQGSTFWFTVNLGSIPNPGPSREPLAALPAPTSVEPLEARKRVLIAEDSVVNRRLALHMVRRLGYDGEVAVDGLEAVDAVRCEAFDAILMDCQMPRMDGFEATRAIRNLDGAAGLIPIIAFTASTEPEQRERILAAGMVDAVTKPVAIETLGSALRRWIGPRTAEDPDPAPGRDQVATPALGAGPST